MTRLSKLKLLSCCCVFLASFTLPLTVTAAPKTGVVFNHDIRPILAENCFACHGQDGGSREGGLRLDVRGDALKGGKSGKPAIVPGKLEASELLARVTAHGTDDVMPPAKTGKSISPSQLATLKKWIAQGAEYQGHWAFIPPERPPLPSSEPKHPIDKFVASDLATQKLSFSAEANRATLLRRLSLDLTGIPPTPQELESFQSDNSTGSYEKQVNRLLSSPRFGEKWARHWLDAARYSDSDGYEKDLPRNQWPWRDWVIKAINADMPYDKFIIEQLAGDLLPNALQEQKVATGFLRNSMVNEEGAIIFEQFRTEGVIDRMDCLGKAVLGITLQCAQCHTHKFDPLTHKEYFSLFAFINNDYEKISPIYSPEQLDAVQRTTQEIATSEAALKAAHPDWQTLLQKWEAQTRTNLVFWEALNLDEYEVIGGIAHPEKLPDKSILTLGYRLPNGELFVVTTSPPARMTGLRLDALTHGDLPMNGPGRNAQGSFAVAELVVEAANLGSNNWRKIELTNAVAEFEEKEHPLGEPFKRADDKRVVGSASLLIDGKDETAWGTDRGPGLRNQDLSWAAQFSPTNNWPSNQWQMKITFKFRHGGNDSHGRENNFLGRFKLSITSDDTPVREIVPVSIRKILKIASEKRTADQTAQLFSFWRTTLPEFQAANEKIAALWKQYPEFTNSVLNLEQRKGEFARETFILDRGDWQRPTDKVAPGTPAFLHPFPKRAPLNRVGLAQWLVDTNSPTTARVLVNRVWQNIFGLGLVETPEDFGVRAALPTHPELLDWLAIEFMEPQFAVASGEQAWSLKHVVRTIVTSATYKQKSAVTPKLLEQDPLNRYLSRGPRFRPDAEVIRDIALSASGLLHEQLGGPSFFPPVPESVFAQSFTKINFWETATGPERYRRSLYVFRRRSMPDPAMSSFDAPNGDVACVRRPRSNTPLAALTSLNETMFVEAAQALALRTLKEGGKTDEERAAYAFTLCTSRVPEKKEVRAILELLKSRQDKIAEGWLAPKEIVLDTPEKLKQLPVGTTPNQAAAWTIVSRVLLNLDETLSKN